MLMLKSSVTAKAARPSVAARATAVRKGDVAECEF